MTFNICSSNRQVIAGAVGFQGFQHYNDHTFSDDYSKSKAGLTRQQFLWAG